MKLYLAPGGCSLAVHIALAEFGYAPECETVDLKTGKTETGADFHAIAGADRTSALVLDDGTVLTECLAILTWIAERYSSDSTEPLARFRRLEMLSHIQSQIRGLFDQVFDPSLAAEHRQRAAGRIAERLADLGDRLKTPWLLGDRWTVADAYLFVMLSWAARKRIAIPMTLRGYYQRSGSLPGAMLALGREGLLAPAAASGEES